MADGLTAEARSLLASGARTAHLATCRDGRPHVAPLWFALDGDAIEIATTGRKLEDLRSNPRVALSVQRDDEGDPVWGVSVHGTATVLEDQAAAHAVIRRINRRYGADPDAWLENTAVRIDVGSSSAWRY